MAIAVFAYGTLVLPEVMQAVTGRDFASHPALLRGWARRRLRERSFPGLVESVAAVTPGVLYAGIDEATLADLDRFEGRLYERVTLRVEPAGGAPTQAFVWRLAPEAAALATSEPWEPAAFTAAERAAFLAECRAFRAGLGPGPAARAPS